ncbi:MAG: YdcF family protein, partial [Defluviitaleaceae bacterium]|nr:YdcF family protein [Defluviitaleaceae bacterium]
KDWLIENGIPSYAILKEENSRNTYENFKYSQILGRDTRHITNGSIIIATNDFHMFRSIRTANLFFEDVYAISAPTSAGFRKTLAILREPFSLIKLAFDHLMHN